MKPRVEALGVIVAVLMIVLAAGWLGTFIAMILGSPGSSIGMALAWEYKTVLYCEIAVLIVCIAFGVAFLYILIKRKPAGR